MTAALFLVPLVTGLVALAIPSDRPQRFLLIGGATAHLALVIAALIAPPDAVLGGYLHADALGTLFLAITSGLFFAASVYAVGYLRREKAIPHSDWVEGRPFVNLPERIMVGCMLLFLAAMTLVALSQHMGLLWVAVEATTLVSAPLIYFHKHHRSLEATWKFLVISSVGIALALLGTFFLAVAASTPEGGGASLLIADLIAAGPGLDPAWLEAAFILLLVGYGAKMGLAPMHTWLPDAHSESPSLVSALMSGALLNCAFLSILRAYQIMIAAGQGAQARDLLLGFGILSMAVAAVFIMRQTDFKRMLAYSSVEHMGILAVGIGISGAATYGAMLHAVNHSLTKGFLFLVAGNVLATYRTTGTRGVRGMLHVLPISGVLWVVGFLAITGSPPFGTFLSEFVILQAAVADGRMLVAAIYVGLLVLVFVGMAPIFLRMAQGEPWETPVKRRKEAVLSVAPPIALALGALLLGVYIPSGVETALQDAAALLGGE